MIIVGHAFDGGLFLVGPFPTEEKADEWIDDRGCGGTSIPCLDPNDTIVDRCGFPLHKDDWFRS